MKRKIACFLVASAIMATSATNVFAQSGVGSTGAGAGATNPAGASTGAAGATGVGAAGAPSSSSFGAPGMNASGASVAPGMASPAVTPNGVNAQSVTPNLGTTGVTSPAVNAPTANTPSMNAPAMNAPGVNTTGVTVPNVGTAGNRAIGTPGNRGVVAGTRTTSPNRNMSVLGQNAPMQTGGETYIIQDGEDLWVVTGKFKAKLDVLIYSSDDMQDTSAISPTTHASIPVIENNK